MNGLARLVLKIKRNIEPESKKVRVLKELIERSNGQCELCSSTEGLASFTVTPKAGDSLEEVIYACEVCTNQITGTNDVNSSHWRCLNESMWSEVPAVKVVAWRMLTNLKSEGWPLELLEMMYLEEDTEIWAKEDFQDPDEEKIIHRDCNGVVLEHGDSVVVIKDLNVKGSSLVAKRGMAVRNISLVYDNTDQIEGKVEGQRVVLLTKYVKK